MIVQFFQFDAEGRIEVNPNLYTILPFNRFKAIDKRTADHRKLMAYIYWCGLVYSPYFIDVDKKNKQQVKEAQDKIILDTQLEDNFDRNNEIVLECITAWENMQRTPTLDTLEAIGGSIVGLREYLKNINLNATIQAGPRIGSLLHNPKAVASLGRELNGLVEEFEKVKNKVKEEYNEALKIRGGGSLNPRENR